MNDAAGLTPTGNMDYFKLRGIDAADYAEVQLPSWLAHRLEPLSKSVDILDFGCGFGQNLQRMRERGFRNLWGADINAEALAHCRSTGLDVIDLTDGSDKLLEQPVRFDLIVTTHVLEHLPKDAIIPTLKVLRRLLKPSGRLMVAVPNAQAYTGAYWAYEDFTHNTLFTSGSLIYVLRAAGFGSAEIIDRRGTEGLGKLLAAVRSTASVLHEGRYWFWKKMLASPTHVASIDVFTYEVKALAGP